MRPPIYSNNRWLKKRAHTGCTPPKIVHPAMEMCTPGAGCTLNFGHCGALSLGVISKDMVLDGFLENRGHPVVHLACSLITLDKKC